MKCFGYAVKEKIKWKKITFSVHPFFQLCHCTIIIVIVLLGGYILQNFTKIKKSVIFWFLCIFCSKKYLISNKISCCYEYQKQNTLQSFILSHVHSRKMNLKCLSLFLIKGIYRCIWVTRWSIKNTTWQNLSLSLSLSLSQKSESWPAFSLAFTSVSGIYIWRDSIFDDFNIYISVKKASMLSSLIFTINKLIVNAVCSCIILKGLSSWCNRGHYNWRIFIV